MIGNRATLSCSVCGTKAEQKETCARKAFFHKNTKLAGMQNFFSWN